MISTLLVLWVILMALWIVALERRLQSGRSRFPGHLYPLLPALLFLVWAQPGMLPAPLAQAIEHSLGMALTLWGLLTIVWLVGTVLRNHSIMDIAYPLAPWAALLVVWQAGGSDRSAHTLALLACATIWAWRLAIYLALRYLPHGEEARYARWRARGGADWWWWSYFQIYLTQAVIVWIWSWPLALALGAQGPLSLWAWAGLACWAVGFVFEALGDLQMQRFRNDPMKRGQVMDRGLWAWTRHPNYFGEAMIWLGYGLFALAAPWGWLGLPCVAMVFWFMNQGSATRMTEAYLLKTKPGYAAYRARTPRFFPRWPSKR